MAYYQIALSFFLRSFGFRFGLTGTNLLFPFTLIEELFDYPKTMKKANTPLKAAINTLFVQSDHITPPIPNNKKIHQHPVPQ